MLYNFTEDSLNSACEYFISIPMPHYTSNSQIGRSGRCDCQALHEKVTHSLELRWDEVFRFLSAQPHSATGQRGLRKITAKKGTTSNGK